MKYLIFSYCILLFACVEKHASPVNQIDIQEVAPVSAQQPSPNAYLVVPGVSLGDVRIDETKESLLAKGFKEDSNYQESEKYLIRDSLHVFLVDEKAQKIWLAEKDRHKLRFRDHEIPLSAQAIKKLFSDCSTEQSGSGGKSFFCENHGISFSTYFPSDDYVAVSVVKRNSK